MYKVLKNTQTTVSSVLYSSRLASGVLGPDVEELIFGLFLLLQCVLQLCLWSPLDVEGLALEAAPPRALLFGVAVRADGTCLPEAG